MTTPRHSQRPDGVLGTLGLCMLALLAGCTMHETYGNADLPESELAVVEGYWHYRFLYDEELHIVSVDGRRKGDSMFDAYSVSVPSGQHWLQLSVKRNSGEIARCAFEWQFQAKHHYKVKRLLHDQVLLAHPVSSPFTASLSIEVTAPDNSARLAGVPAVCAREALCRQDSECPPDRSCQPAAGFELGICTQRGR